MTPAARAGAEAYSVRTRIFGERPMKARMRSATVSGAAILLLASVPAMAQRAYIDPATGQLTAPPAGAAKRAPSSVMASGELRW